MGTQYTSDRIADALLGDVRQAVLGILFIAPDELLHVREIIRRAGAGQGAVQRELQRLHGAGLLVREERGNQVCYRPDRSAPVFAELRSLVLKTSGLAHVLSEALRPVADSIEVAFVHGSIASGEASAASDVDLFIVGDVDDLALHEAIETSEQTLSRPVNYTLMSTSEFSERLAEPEGFVRRVLDGPRIPIIGDVVDV
ncbi:MAG TPA: nucleotidyltransferase domain-containing protein [Coriobacteriia bacterium]|nr:nucleotidyltransferase domain-containing protein [Coriobacteriia bacterium]